MHTCTCNTQAAIKGTHQIMNAHLHYAGSNKIGLTETWKYPSRNKNAVLPHKTPKDLKHIIIAMTDHNRLLA